MKNNKRFPSLRIIFLALAFLIIICLCFFAWKQADKNNIYRNVFIETVPPCTPPVDVSYIGEYTHFTFINGKVTREIELNFLEKSPGAPADLNEDFFAEVYYFLHFVSGCDTPILYIDVDWIDST